MRTLRRAMRFFLKAFESFLGGKTSDPTFEAQFRRWHDSKLRQPDDHMKLLKAFLADGGHRLTAAAKMTNSRVGCHDFSNFPSTVGLSPSSPEYRQALESLRSDGYAILPQRLSSAAIFALAERFSANSLKMVSDDAAVNGKLSALNLAEPQAEKYEVSTADVLDSPLAQDLLFDGGILSLAQDYLGSAPILDIATSWFSFPVGRSSQEAATQFHFDLDRTRWVKIFYFLTDVNERTGAHLFVPGSQADGSIPSKILSKGYSRLTDSEVDGAFPKDSWQTIGGPAGTILLEDTRGLHKGMPLVEGHRLVLQFQYSVDLFGAPSHLSSLMAPPSPSGLPSDVVGQLLSSFEK